MKNNKVKINKQIIKIKTRKQTIQFIYKYTS